MRTRSGVSYPRVVKFCFQSPIRLIEICKSSRKRGRGEDFADRGYSVRHKRTKMSPPVAGCGGGVDLFDSLPDDLIVCILSRISASASSPADFAAVLLTCKRFNGLGLQPTVLAKASPSVFAVKAKSWSESAHRFLKRSAVAGNLEACYTLGMIRFYCLQNRASGASLMAKAAIGSHSQAMFSLAVIQFNGSGGAKSDRDLRAGVALCGRAAVLGHVDALRELGHCLQDGYGVRQNVIEGRRFLVQANAKEFAAVAVAVASSDDGHPDGASLLPPARCPLLSDFGYDVPPPEVHPANRFLLDWFTGSVGEGLMLCSNDGCGRPETRPHEFRRCSVCGRANYCSRACQALDWKFRHKDQCGAMQRWAREDAGGEI